MATVTFLPVLNEVEKQSLHERQPLPEAYLGLVRRRDAGPDRGRARRARRSPRDPRAPLSARRGDPLRRLHRRLVEAVARHRAARRRRLHRLLWRALHGRERGPARAAAPASDPAGSGGGLFDGGHGRRRSARDVLGGARAAGTRQPRDSGHLHQLGGRHQGVRRRAGRDRLHLVERRADARVGVGAGREDSVPARSASGTQHRLEDGRAARSAWSSGIHSSPTAVSRATSSSTRG